MINRRSLTLLSSFPLSRLLLVSIRYAKSGGTSILTRKGRGKREGGGRRGEREREREASNSRTIM